MRLHALRATIAGAQRGVRTIRKRGAKARRNEKCTPAARFAGTRNSMSAASQTTMQI
jgi:hypothetical protein